MQAASSRAPGLLDIFDGGDECRADAGEPGFVHGDQQVFLGGEVVIEGRGADAGGVGDVAHRGRRVALVQELPGGGFQDALALHLAFAGGGLGGGNDLGARHYFLGAFWGFGARSAPR